MITSPASNWRRVLSYLIDVALLSILGQGLGWALPRPLVALGLVGPVLGLGLATLWMGWVDRAGQGCTPGQRLMGLRTVGLDGRPPPRRARWQRALWLGVVVVANQGDNSDPERTAWEMTGWLLSGLPTLILLTHALRGRGAVVHDDATGTTVARAPTEGASVARDLCDVDRSVIGAFALALMLGAAAMGFTEHSELGRASAADLEAMGLCRDARVELLSAPTPDATVGMRRYRADGDPSANTVEISCDTGWLPVQDREARAKEVLARWGRNGDYPTGLRWLLTVGPRWTLGFASGWAQPFRSRLGDHADGSGGLSPASPPARDRPLSGSTATGAARP